MPALNPYLQWLADWRALRPDKAHWTDEKILEDIMLRLSKSHPDRVSFTVGPDGVRIWTIKPDPCQSN